MGRSTRRRTIGAIHWAEIQRTRERASLVGLAVAAAIAAAACGGSVTPGAASSSSSQEAAVATFTLRSSSLAPDGSIPQRYSCDGQNVSPALDWSDAPGSTAAFALIVDDPDANGFVHWVVFNMTGSASGALPEAVSASPDAPPQGRNGFGRIGYGGPCPPSGTHHYRFTLYALSGPLEIAGQPSADEVHRAIGPVLLGQAVLTGAYTRRR